MMNTLKLLVLFLIFPGLVFSSLVGLFTSWVDRKISARLQYRQGPPWYQPFADILKLFGKEIFIPEGGASFIFLAAPWLGLSAVTLVATMLWQFNVHPAGSFIGDLIVVLYLLTVPSLALMLGGSASRNPFAAIGASREMKLILAYELPFLLATFTLVAKSGSILIGSMVAFQQSHGMLALSLSGMLALLVSILVMQAKLGFVPFDIPEAEQEIMGGPLLEYSGLPLAVFKLNKALLFYTLPLFLITLYLGGFNPYSWVGILGLVIKYILLLVIIILIKNTNPRIRTDQALRFFWGPVTILAAAGFIFALIGW